MYHMIQLIPKKLFYHNILINEHQFFDVNYQDILTLHY